jgi:hypothetical protein
MLEILLLTGTGGLLGAAVYWILRRGGRGSGGALRAEVDRLHLPEAEAAYDAARQAYLAAAARPGSGPAAEACLERAVFLLDRIHRLQGMTHGAGARERWKDELRQQAGGTPGAAWNPGAGTLPQG